MPAADPPDLVRSALAARSPASHLEALWRPLDGVQRGHVLDELARQAAADVEGALDVLLTVIDGERLAVPPVRRLVSNQADVEDVVQDVLLAVARSIGGFGNEARFTTWLHAVARNTAIAHLRRCRATEALGQREPSDGASRISSVVASRTTIRAALAMLPPTYREPVQLRDVDGLSYQDVADRLGLNLNTARSRIARGRSMLARAVEGGAATEPQSGPDPAN